MTTDTFYSIQTPEPGVTISLSTQTRAHLDSLYESEGEPYKDRMDAFRFAVSMALALRQDDPPNLSQGGETMYNIGSFDRDGVFKEVFQIVAPQACKTTPLTQLIRCYGEWGVQQMHESMLEHGGEFNIPDAIARMQEQIDKRER